MIHGPLVEAAFAIAPHHLLLTSAECRQGILGNLENRLDRRVRVDRFLVVAPTNNAYLWQITDKGVFDSRSAVPCARAELGGVLQRYYYQSDNDCVVATTDKLVEQIQQELKTLGYETVAFRLD